MTDYTFKIPGLGEDAEPVEFTLSSGQHAFVLGPNGSGKSSLMQYFYRAHHKNCVRMSAHRQTWFTSDSLDLSPQSKRQSEKNIKTRDTQLEARWKDDMAAARANIAIYDLIDAENVRARKIAAAVDGGQLGHAAELALEDAPIAIINELMILAGLTISLAIHENERILARRKDSEPYSIAELSDGERNALLLAAAVLTAPPNSLILVDEPERHLHRSIISPLLTHLFARRGDCVCVISTHEVLLPIDNAGSITLLVRSCEYSNKNPLGWEIDVVEGDADIPEEMKCDILGSRKRVLFIEGTEDSLDKPLYGILFPDASVVAKGNCIEVERATVGVRGTAEHHWAEAFGLVDGDGRSKQDVEEMEGKGVYATPCYSVESLYYDPVVLKAIAERVAALDGSDPEARLANATRNIITSVEPHKGRLCSRVVNLRLRDSVLRSLPLAEQYAGDHDLDMSIPIGSMIKEEEARFRNAIDEGDVAHLVRRYPVRETPALSQAAAELGFRTRRDYEAAVLRACNDSEDLKKAIMGMIGGLAAMLSESKEQEVEEDVADDPPPAEG